MGAEHPDSYACMWLRPYQIPEELLVGYEKLEDLLDSEGLLAHLQKAVMERAGH